EFVKSERAYLYGEDVPSKPSVNTVTDAPKNFYDWVSENRERLSHSKSLPYFVRDNKDYFKSVTFNKSVTSQFRESK
ncbi:MAG: hypothetical protein K5685_09690, partial [Bacteroidales bacterium]|nr:hypothetical protein [Bacteroidales bacterium]